MLVKHIEADYISSDGLGCKRLEEIDIWMLQKLSKTTESVKKLYLSYNISGARKEIEEFWDES